MGVGEGGCVASFTDTDIRYLSLLIIMSPSLLQQIVSDMDTSTTAESLNDISVFSVKFFPAYTNHCGFF